MRENSGKDDRKYVHGMICSFKRDSGQFCKENIHDQQAHEKMFNIISYCCCCCVASVMSDSVRPHSQQPTRLPRPWDSPGKNTGVGCHFLLQCIKMKVKSISRARLSATPWTAAHQAPLSMGFSRQEY